MKKEYTKPFLKVVNLDMQVLLCGSNSPSEDPMYGMNSLPSDPGSGTINSSSNIWMSNTSSIWD